MLIASLLFTLLLLLNSAENAVLGGGSALGAYVFSCGGAKQTHEGTANYCPFIDWLSAGMYNASNFNIYNPGSSFDLDSQNDVAKSIGQSILSTSSDSVSSACQSAIQRFACVSSFPLCEAQGSSISSISYVPPCKLQCDQVNKACRPSVFSARASVTLDCSNLLVNHNCALNIPEGRFFLSPQKGPYLGVAAVYLTMLAVWAALTIWWSVQTDLMHEGEAPLTKSAAVIPVLRTAVSALALAFWMDCSSSGDMCRVNFASALTVLYPFVEAAQMFIWLAAAKGWGTTRSHLPLGTWRVHIVVTFGFYVALTVLTGSFETPSTGWAIYAVCTYGLLYALILQAGWRQQVALRGQAAKLPPGACALAAEPLRLKLRAFRCFLLLVFAQMALEVLCRCLLVAPDVPFVALVVVYEVTSTVLLVAVGACFAPRSYSPFHFMVPTSLEFATLPAADVVAGDGAGGEEDARTARVRRVLSSRYQVRERDEDGAAMQALRAARAQRPSPVVHAFLRSGNWWQRDSDSSVSALLGAEEGRAAIETMPVNSVGGVEMQASHPGWSHGAEGTFPARAAASLDLSRLLALLPSTGRGAERAGGPRGAEWGMGGDHALPVPSSSPGATAWRTVAAEGAQRARASGSRLVALTSPGPTADDAEVLLAAQHFAAPTIRPNS